jgi:hypothetical protein
MRSTTLRRAALALPAAILVMGAGTAALASPRSAPARPATRHEPAVTPAQPPAATTGRDAGAEVPPQIGTALKMVRNPDGSITVTER